MKVMVCGCNGQMGQIVCRLLEECDDMELICGIDNNIGPKDSKVYEDIKKVEAAELIPDIIIDFSQEKCTMDVLENFAVPHKIPMVIATTGYEDEDEALSRIKSAAKQTLVFFASNMSYSVCIVEQLLRELAPKLPDYDIEIVETHHNRKKDAPSGTAKLFVKAINAYLSKPKKMVYGRTGKREADEIGVSSLRGGNIVGTHSIHFIGKSDTIEITHTALSREMFAEGAIKAARFLLKQKESGETKGFFKMKDLI